MSMRLNIIWHDDDAFTYQSNCGRCAFVSLPFDDEDAAHDAWHGHACA
jgi:hypothetical protein